MKISIITPSLNQGRFIERTLESVARQNVKNIEHIVFDGGSNDETLDILRRCSLDVSWKSEPDSGQAHAVNKGILASNGDIIGWLNSDDIYYPYAIDRVLNIFSTRHDIDVIYGMAEHIDTEDTPFEDYPTEEWNSARLQETCFICQPALFFRRNIVERFGLLDQSLHYCMDYEYWLRLSKANVSFFYLKEKLAGSRMYEDNKTLSSVIPVHREINDMFRNCFGKVPDAWLYNYAYVVTRERINENLHATRFHRETAIRTLLASLRWNRCISRSLLHRLHPRWF
ncbi:MAG: glycosyltransferase [Xanthomonadaceae bacterium]|jgi:glycosyltransferase involved in cell wall biosynthesis|nr:glycosyltransferase [Xanthomonadaceae bacterium]